LKAIGFPPTRPLMLLVQENVGKALGYYVTEWGNNSHRIIVVDEIEIRDARFAQVGAMHNQVVPIAFYGMN
jgi:ethanolamine utilization protein EutA (predicted chaperonin)